MTPTERAEKIANHFVAERCTGDGDFDKLVQWIVIQISEAEREAIVIQWDKFNNQLKTSCKLAFENGRIEGFHAAREKAAEIVLGLFFQALGKNEEAEKWLADRIRQMEPS